MLISLIIVNFKTEKYVLDCISSIQKHSEEEKYEIIVVDNSSDSTDFRNNLIAQEVIYINSNKNIGFGRACNLGAASAKGEILIFVNPDIVFLENVIKIIREAIANSHTKKIVGINLIDSKGRHAVSGGSFPSIATEIFEIFGVHKLMPKFYLNLSLSRIYSTENFEELEVDYVCGALFGMSASNFHELNGFSNEFFLYFEETELMYRHHRMHGKVILLPKVSAKHIGSVSTIDNSDFKISQLELGRHLFYRTRYKALIPFLLVCIIRAFRLLLLSILKRRILFAQLIPTSLIGKPPRLYSSQ